MVNYQLPNENITGLDNLFSYTSGQIPLLIPGILFMVWIIIALGGYFSQERSRGKGSFAMWNTIAGVIVSISSFILFLTPGLMNLETLTIIITITIASAFWFIFSSD